MLLNANCTLNKNKWKIEHIVLIEENFVLIEEKIKMYLTHVIVLIIRGNKNVKLLFYCFKRRKKSINTFSLYLFKRKYKCIATLFY